MPTGLSMALLVKTPSTVEPEWEDELSIRLNSSMWSDLLNKARAREGFAQRFLLATFGDDDWITTALWRGGCFCCW